ncbi:MAG: 5'-methylthioinosine phosphorylase [Gammaproteobacteria bacterium]|jgi:5'-methylthioinosine phosphorylase
MTKVAIIGGSGLDNFTDLTGAHELRQVTRFGQPSGSILSGTFAGCEILFLARHGSGHTIPPHKINYRANIAALRDLGATEIIAVTAVGGIAATAPPRRIVIPNQIVDYTYGREHTFSDGLDDLVQHIDFTYPFCARLREELTRAAAQISLSVEATGVYGATQGPRLETAAEISRMAKDGCTIVGMTGMPEASLAREAGLNYVNCSLVVNWAAGVVDGTIEFAEIEEHLKLGMTEVQRLLKAWLEQRTVPDSEI